MVSRTVVGRGNFYQRGCQRDGGDAEKGGHERLGDGRAASSGGAVIHSGRGRRGSAAAEALMWMMGAAGQPTHVAAATERLRDSGCTAQRVRHMGEAHRSVLLGWEV